MKPTDKQKAIAKVIERQGQFWQSTNDINSPTHWGDIDEEIMAQLEMEDLIDEKDIPILAHLLGELYSLVKRN